MNAQGDYALVRRIDRLIFSAGFTPRDENDRLLYSGVVGAGMTDADAREAAALATRRALRAIGDSAGNDSVLRIDDLVVFVRTTDEHAVLSAIGDAATGTIREELGQVDPPCRAVVGVSMLPGGALVEVKLTASVT